MYRLFVALFGLSVTALYTGTMRSYLVLLHPEPLNEWSGSTIAEAIALLVSIGLGVWSYARTVLTPPGFANDPGVQAWLQRHAGNEARTSSENVCKHCGDKPLRAYHCRHTGRCVLRLDHYCLFSDCAIGAGNHKYFLLWQFYQLISSAQMIRLNFAAVSAAVRSGTNSSISSSQLTQMMGRLILGIVCLLGAVFTFAAPAGFFPAHLYRAAHNISGVEYAKDLRCASANSKRTIPRNADAPRDTDTEDVVLGATTGSTYAEMYDCGGIMRNLDTVLGNRRLLWLLPVAAPGLACVLSPAAQRRFTNVKVDTE